MLKIGEVLDNSEIIDLLVVESEENVTKENISNFRGLLK